MELAPRFADDIDSDIIPYRRYQKTEPMVEEPEKLVLTYLRRMDEKLNCVSDDIRDVKHRVSRLEQEVAGLHADVAGLSSCIDRVETRLDRIEQRLDIIEA